MAHGWRVTGRRVGLTPRGRSPPAEPRGPPMGKETSEGGLVGRRPQRGPIFEPAGPRGRRLARQGPLRLGGQPSPTPALAAGPSARDKWEGPFRVLRRCQHPGPPQPCLFGAKPFESHRRANSRRGASSVGLLFIGTRQPLPLKRHDPPAPLVAPAETP